jgi:hypothetical protein
MRLTIRPPAVSIARLAVLAVSGCLSVGGKTYETTTRESPETAKRIASLESRVGALEHVVGTAPPGSAIASATPSAADTIGSLPPTSNNR